MLLDLKRKILFLLIPKNASSSVRQTLMSFDRVNIFCNQDAHQGFSSYRMWMDIFEDLQKVAIVRNPLDRQISWWRYEWGTLGTKRRICTTLPMQLSYCCDRDGNLQVDHTLRFENLKEDWEKFARPLGYPDRLKHLNPSPPDIPKPSIDRAFTKWVQTTYTQDYENFGYPMMDEVTP